MIRQLLEKREDRQLTLLEILYSNDDWMNVSALAEMLGCSERILKQDVADLKAQFSDEILLTSNQGIFLTFPSNLNLEIIYQAVLKDSLAFQLLEYLFFDETKSMNELAEILYISKSTLIRTVKKINETLEPFGFQITNTNACMIIGNEVKIRSFFILYFSERYSFSEWPFPTIDEETFEKVLLFLTKFNKFKLNFSDFIRLKKWIAVPIIRTNHQHYVAVQQHKLAKMIPNLSSISFLVESFKNKLSISLDPLYLEQIFFIFLRENFILSYDDLLVAIKNNHELKKNFTLIKKLVNSLSKSFNIPIPNFEHLILDLFNISYINVGESTEVSLMPFILFDQKKYFIQSIHKDYPSFITAAYKALNKYQKDSGLFFSSFALDELLYTIIIHWDQLLIELQKQKRKVKIVVLSSYDLEHAKMIQDILSIQFSNIAEISIYEKPKLSKKELAKIDFDLIVTTTSLKELDENKVICIQNIPSDKDVKEIYEAILACSSSFSQ